MNSVVSAGLNTISSSGSVLFRMAGVPSAMAVYERWKTRIRGPCRSDSRHSRRERRRQVDADQDHGRCRCARRGCDDPRWQGRTLCVSAAAEAAGIACIFQELSLVPDLSVADNIVISNPPRRFGMIDRRAQRRIAEEALARAGGDDIHPRSLIKDLPLSRRQIVEIAKALALRPRILILDEATSALTAADVARFSTY